MSHLKALPFLTPISVLPIHLSQVLKDHFPSVIQTTILCTFIISPHIMLVPPILCRLIR